uniref:Uncharacterized protein n=1 Tax=Klebsiella pneumoniae TaxID=573 RepID=A0A8B0SW76_KLEPN|nr:hypothetical protein [Klebsiella pneumoniae]
MYIVFFFISKTEVIDSRQGAMTVVIPPCHRTRILKLYGQSD